jgi:hypothetical protein
MNKQITMNKQAAPKTRPVLPKPIGPASAFKPSPQMPWTGQRGTLEDLSSFGISPEEFFGGGGRVMFTDTAPKPALPPKQGNMNTQQQAYIQGFTKRAAAYGFDENEALILLKQSQAPAPVVGSITTGDTATSNSPGFLDKIKNWVGGKFPGYPTSAGSTQDHITALTKKVHEMAGGD